MKRRDLIAAAAALPVLALANPAQAQMTDEDEYWFIKAVLLDPTIYTYLYDWTFHFEVPAGETWYAVNLWNVSLNGHKPYFHRHLHVDNALALTAGTVIETAGMFAAGGLAFFARPALAAPMADPRATYFSRLAQLRQLPQYIASQVSPAGPNPYTYYGVYFDNDFEYGMLNHISAHDLSWVLMAGQLSPHGQVNVVNTQNEISDVHTMRFCGNVLCPFINGLYRTDGSGWTGMWVQGGNPQGVVGAQVEGHGHAMYQKLPVTWPSI